MTSSDYLTVNQLKSALRIDSSNDRFDGVLAMAISSASRQIDEHCDDQFWCVDTPEPRLFVSGYPRRLVLPSFASRSGLVVEIDLDDDGVFETTWTEGQQFQVVPVAPLPGRPFTGLETLGSSWLPTTHGHYGITAGGDAFYGPMFGGEWWPRSQRARVRVTAKWGWASVPAQVMQSCQILATDHYKSKDVTDGSSGVQGMSTGRFGSGRTAGVTPSALNPMATNLLSGLRDLVIA